MIFGYTRHSQQILFHSFNFLTIEWKCKTKYRKTEVWIIIRFELCNSINDKENGSGCSLFRQKKFNEKNKNQKNWDQVLGKQNFADVK